MTFKITGDIARDAICRRIMHAPLGQMVRISEPSRSLEQNALLHAELQEISQKLKWAGGFRSVDDWKRLLTAAWMRATDRKVVLLPAVDGEGFDVLYQRTSTLTKTEMVDLVAYIQAWKSDRPEFEYEEKETKNTQAA